MLKGARIQAQWMPAPGAEEVMKADRERLIEALLAPVEIEDEDRALAERLIAERTPEDIAAMLVQAHRAKLPVPESLVEGSDAGPPERRERIEGVWFRIDIGRQHNADPRWLLPLLCRRGHITKGEVGAIRIGPNETLFEIHPAAAQKFQQSVKRTAGKDDNDVTIEPVPGGAPSRAGAPSGPHRHRRAGPPPRGGRPGGPRR
jgi:ATP-dependent RNA helicase DeaD